MSDEGRRFLEACGVAGPLRFEWTDPTMVEARSRDIEQAAFVVGRDPAADLVLDDPSVEPFQALFQVVDGRLFVIDLGSGPGLRWGEIPRQAGWVHRGQRLRIGGSMVRFVGGDRDGAESIIEPAPISSRYVGRPNLSRVVLEFRTAAGAEDGWQKREILDRVLVLAGSSERCKLRAVGRRVARFTCALIRTPTGLWMTNIVPGMGATVNGALCRFARLEDKDIIQIGPFGIRVIYNDSVKASLVRAPRSPVNAVLGPSVQPGPLGETGLALDESAPEVLLQSLLDQEGREPGVMASPFGQALVLMVRLLGDVHRDHLALIRDELAEIRRLSRDMDSLRTEMPPPALQPISLPPADPATEMGGPVGLGPSLEPEPIPRPGPEAVREIIGERLAAWERERQSRWRRVLKLLTGS